MSTNKLALIRYKTIDNCLRQKHRKWTLDELIEKVSEQLYELEGIHNGVSKRTIQADIQLMRSNKLGYNAPIIVTDRKYYSYEDPSYSISNSPISATDMEKMKEVVEVLKHLNGFAYFEEMSDIIARLEDNMLVSSGEHKQAIQMESNTLLKGLNWINILHRAIREEIPLLITYKSFKTDTASDAVYFPYLLKEYRNRWFLICRHKKNNGIQTLALDRIHDIAEMAKSHFEPYEGVDFERYYADTIGVTKSLKDRGNKVLLHVESKNAPYVETKPLHNSQQILNRFDDGSIIIRIDVVLNFELEREILGFGECMKVLAPRYLVNRIKRRITQSMKQYSDSPSKEQKTKEEKQ